MSFFCWHHTPINVPRTEIISGLQLGATTRELRHCCALTLGILRTTDNLKSTAIGGIGGMFNMQSSSNSSLPRKRRRAAKSCEQCRHRKIGCDQAHPCGPCRRSRDHLNCTYRDLATTAPPSVQPESDQIGNGPTATASGPERPYPHQTSRFEVSDTGPAPAGRTWGPGDLAIATSNGHRQIAGQFSDSGIVTGPGAGGRAYDMIQKLEARVQRLEAESRSAQEGIDGRASTPYLSASAMTVPLLRFTMAKVKMFTQSHWVHTAKKVFFSIPGEPCEDWA